MFHATQLHVLLLFVSCTDGVRGGVWGGVGVAACVVLSHMLDATELHIHVSCNATAFAHVTCTHSNSDFPRGSLMASKSLSELLHGTSFFFRPAAQMPSLAPKACLSICYVILLRLCRYPSSRNELYSFWSVNIHVLDDFLQLALASIDDDAAIWTLEVAMQQTNLPWHLLDSHQSALQDAGCWLHAAFEKMWQLQYRDTARFVSSTWSLSASSLLQMRSLVVPLVHQCIDWLHLARWMSEV